MLHRENTFFIPWLLAVCLADCSVGTVFIVNQILWAGQIELKWSFIPVSPVSRRSHVGKTFLHACFCQAFLWHIHDNSQRASQKAESAFKMLFMVSLCYWSFTYGYQSESCWVHLQCWMLCSIKAPAFVSALMNVCPFQSIQLDF